MKINRLKLLSALEAVRPGLSAKEIIEQSTSFAFKNGRVYSYNDSIAISHPCPKGLVGVVRSKELHALLSKSTDDELDITQTESELRIIGKHTRAGIVLQSEITLPIKEVEEKEWTSLPADFSKAIRFVLFSAGKDMTKPWSTAIHFTNAYIETCDNFRLTQYILPKRNRMPIVKVDVLIPATACSELIKHSPTHYSIDEQWIHFTNEAGAEFSSRIVADSFPNLRPFIEREWQYAIKFHEDTTNILERACVFLMDKTIHPTVTIKTENESMIISTKGSSGWFEETIDIPLSKETTEFIIDPMALKDMLPLLKNCMLSNDKSVLKFEGENFVHCCSTVCE